MFRELAALRLRAFGCTCVALGAVAVYDTSDLVDSFRLAA